MLKVHLLVWLKKTKFDVFLKIVASFKIIQDVEYIIKSKKALVLLVLLESMRD